MNKSVELIAAVLDGHWDEASDLATEYCLTSDKVAELVGRIWTMCSKAHVQEAPLR